MWTGQPGLARTGRPWPSGTPPGSPGTPRSPVTGERPPPPSQTTPSGCPPPGPRRNSPAGTSRRRSPRAAPRRPGTPRSNWRRPAAPLSTAAPRRRRPSGGPGDRPPQRPRPGRTRTGRRHARGRRRRHPGRDAGPNRRPDRRRRGPAAHDRRAGPGPARHPAPAPRRARRRALMPPRYRRPVGPAERARREQATADKLTALHERLAEQVAALRSGEDWRRWLDVARRFHNYSFNNTLLIAAQRPDATAVAGYEAWKALGRQVDKGERGLQILAPVVRRGRAGDDAGAAAAEPGGTDADPAERADTAPSGAASGTKEKGDRRGGGQVTGWRVAYVWDVSATSGEPLLTPPRPRLLAGQAPPGLWEALTRVVGERGFTVARGDCGPANGWTDYATRTVRVRADVDAAQAVKTLAHEAGHVLLHDPADSTLPPGSAGISRTATTPGTPTGAGATTAQCRGVREVEAESVAYLVAATHGLPTDDYTFAYVTRWAAGVDRAEPERVVRDTGVRVLAAGRAVLAGTQPEATAAGAELAAGAQAGTGAPRRPARAPSPPSRGPSRRLPPRRRPPAGPARGWR